ncbi:hypothetical protein BH18ACT15_BH18ACT15_05900 [soil metagenome]
MSKLREPRPATTFLGLSRANLRHVLTSLRQGRNPAARVYDSIGADFFLAPAPGWLNLGLWEGAGTAKEAPAAVRRLVHVLAADLPTGGVIVDVGNGLGAQDPEIATVARPRALVAVNITESQLRAGHEALKIARAWPVAGDAVHLPLKDDSADGVISVEAAFHFRSRAAFFAEAHRVLKPGGVLTISDVATERRPHRLDEWAAGLLTARVWGLRREAVMTGDEMAGAARSAGLRNVEVERCSDRVIDPALSFFRDRLRDAGSAPFSHRLGAAVVLASWRLLRRRRMIDYIVLRARAPIQTTL